MARQVRDNSKYALPDWAVAWILSSAFAVMTTVTIVVARSEVHVFNWPPTRTDWRIKGFFCFEIADWFSVRECLIAQSVKQLHRLSLNASAVIYANLHVLTRHSESLRYHLGTK